MGGKTVSKPYEENEQGEQARVSSGGRTKRGGSEWGESRRQTGRTSEFGNEESQAYSHRSKKRIFALLRGEHKHDEDQLRGQEHLDEETLRDGYSRC